MKNYFFFIFLLSFFTSLYGYALPAVQVIYDGRKNLELSDYFVHDLKIILGNKQSVFSRLKRDFAFTGDLKKNKKIEEGFLIFSDKKKTHVRYFHSKKNIYLDFHFNMDEVLKRDISINCIKRIYRADIAKIKKKVVVFPFINQTGDVKKKHYSQIITKAIGYELQDTEKVIVLFADSEKELWLKMKKDPQKMAQKDFFRGITILKADAAVYGYYTVKNGKIQIQLSMIRTEKKTPVFNIKESLPIDESLFANAMIISKKIAAQALKRLPSATVKIIKKEEVKLPVKPEEKPIDIIQEEPKEEVKSMEIPDPVLAPIPKAKGSPALIEDIYSDKSTLEIGGMVWFDLKNIKTQNIQENLLTNYFLSYFFTDRFFMGIKNDFQFFTKTNDTIESGYLTFGTALPITKSFFFFNSVQAGYCMNTVTLKDYFCFSDEIGFKIVLKKYFLMNLSAIYSFDFSSGPYTDKIKGNLSFSFYF